MWRGRPSPDASLAEVRGPGDRRPLQKRVLFLICVFIYLKPACKKGRVLLRDRAEFGFFTAHVSLLHSSSVYGAGHVASGNHFEQGILSFVFLALS